jgi:cytidine deaminase
VFSAVTAAETALRDEAAAMLRHLRREGLRTVVAGVRTSAGEQFFGVNLVSRVSSVCAEPAALSAAFTARAAPVTTVVAVCHLPDLSDIVVIGPCGACRELLHAQAPGSRVLIRRPPGELVAAGIEDLLPLPQLFLEAEDR